MDAAVATSSSLVLSCTPRRSLLSFPPSWLPPPCKSYSYSTPSAKQQRRRRLLFVNRLSHKSSRSVLSLRCSSSVTDNPSSSVVSSERWILEPAGDGDWRHIGYRVPRPGGLEIASDAVTVDRVPEKADIVLPVATGYFFYGSSTITNLSFINEEDMQNKSSILMKVNFDGSNLRFHMLMFPVKQEDD